MKIKQLEKGLAEPVNELLPKLQKNDSNSENSDAFEIILSLFTNTLSKLEIQTEQSPIAAEKREFFDNSQVNLFFKQLIKNINSEIPNEIPLNSQNLENEWKEITNPKLLIDQLVNLKNLSQQNTALNSKIASILINSLPNEIIKFLNNDKIELTSNTQNELIQIAKIFEKINSSKSNESGELPQAKVVDAKELANRKVEGFELEKQQKTQPTENYDTKLLDRTINTKTNVNTELPLAKVVDAKNTGKHIVENIEKTAHLLHIESDNKSIKNGLTALSANQLGAEQANLKGITLTQPNQESKNIQNLEQGLSDLKNTNYNTNNNSNNSENESNLNNNYLTKNNPQQDTDLVEDKLITQELKTKANLDFLPQKITNFSQKASNYSMFSSVRHDEIPNYIVRMSNSIKNGGNYRAIMNLKPENLGSIFVNLTIKDDVLNITIKVEMNQTLEKIDSSAANLKEALVGSGFKSENINLRIESNQTSAQNYASAEKDFDNPNKYKQKQELREMIQRIRQYEHILSLVKQQEVVE